MLYAPLLSARYLTSRVIPLVAAAAVALCVALVIIVVSVMTGFLDMVRNSGKTLIGDVVVSRDITGIPYYEEFIAEIEALPEAAAASPIVETFGLLQMPYGPGDGGSQIETVQVWGIDPASLDRVANYHEKLYWRTPEQAIAATLAPDDPRLDPRYDRLADGMALAAQDGTPGIVLGIEISPFNRRTSDGSYRTEGPDGVQDFGYFMPNTTGATLTLVPVSERGSLGGEKKRRFEIVNEFQSGVYQIDAQRILAPLPVVQEMLRLDRAPITSPNQLDENGRPKVVGESPARATTIVVRAEEGVSAVDLRDAVQAAYRRFVARIEADPSRLALMPSRIDVMTWEERLRDLIGPVEKERELMRTLFSIVYIVSAALVLAIFWSIVQEKTRDIGILRAVGAGRMGILLIFLIYGLLIGIVGSSLGVLLAWAVVSRLNEIHDLLGTAAPGWLVALAGLVCVGSVLATAYSLAKARALASVLWSFASILLAVATGVLWMHQGFLVWDPSVYYFSRIPSEIDVWTAALTFCFGVVFSVIGAAVPAARGADFDPVRSLRYD